MTRVRIALLTGSALVTLIGGMLLMPGKSQAFVCSNVTCDSPASCSYQYGSDCSVSKLKTGVFVCVSGGCPE